MAKELEIDSFDRFLRRIISPKRLKRIQESIARKRRKNIESTKLLLAKMLFEQRIRELGIRC